MDINEEDVGIDMTFASMAPTIDFDTSDITAFSVYVMEVVYFQEAEEEPYTWHIFTSSVQLTTK